jgi:adenylate cyclase
MMNKLGKSWKPAVMVLGFAVLVLLVMDFNNRMAELRRLSAEKDNVSARVTSLVQTQKSLETQVAYATSEAAVYYWAYNYERLGKEGDILVVPIQAAGGVPQPTPTPVVTAEVIQNWQVWLSLFVDQPAKSP